MAKRCQSCGMPLGKDLRGGGTQKDGGQSMKYCSFCFEGDEFLHPAFTVLQMQGHCISQLVNKGMAKIMAWLFTRDIPRLGRWCDTG